MLVKGSPRARVPCQPCQHLPLSEGMLPAPAGRFESRTCWHPWPQAGPGLFNPIKNRLDQNYKRDLLPLTMDNCSSGS